MITRKTGIDTKGWGSELIWATNDKYCGKFLEFDKAGSKCSMHFHAEKDETWYVLSGRFLVEYIDTKVGKLKDQYLEKGSVWRNPPLMPHRIVCIDPGTIIEVSTPDSVEDNYRVMPGDSQK